MGWRVFYRVFWCVNLRIFCVNCVFVFLIDRRVGY
jgi:hypothetical protein